MFIGVDAYAPKHWPPQLVHYLNTYGREKVLFGTDWPVVDPERAMGEIGAMDLRPEARALLLRPDWLFLDEATANLDPESEATLLHMLRERLPGTTMVSITHGPGAAEADDRLVRFSRDAGSQGRLEEAAAA